MAWRALTIALLIASAFPPPRVFNALIAENHRDGAGKTLQWRGRNRIGHATPVADVRRDAGLSRNRTQVRRSLLSFAGSFEPPVAVRPGSPCPALRTAFRLRC
jgi:hypothetical protein